jgi:hypothetical protein
MEFTDTHLVAIFSLILSAQRKLAASEMPEPVILGELRTIVGKEMSSRGLDEDEFLDMVRDAFGSSEFLK